MLLHKDQAPNNCQKHPANTALNIKRGHSNMAQCTSLTAVNRVQQSGLSTSCNSCAVLTIPMHCFQPLSMTPNIGSGPWGCDTKVEQEPIRTWNSQSGAQIPG